MHTTITVCLTELFYLSTLTHHGLSPVSTEFLNFSKLLKLCLYGPYSTTAMNTNISLLTDNPKYTCFIQTTEIQNHQTIKCTL